MVVIVWLIKLVSDMALHMRGCHGRDRIVWLIKLVSDMALHMRGCRGRGRDRMVDKACQ